MKVPPGATAELHFFLVDATDGLTAETGEAGGQPQIRVAGGAFTNVGVGVLVDKGSGHYAAVVEAATLTQGVVVEGRYKSAATAEAPSLNILEVEPLQTGDSYARVGAPAGASVSADIAATKVLLPVALVGGRMDASVGAMAAGVVTAAAIATNAIDADAMAADAVAEITAASGGAGSGSELLTVTMLTSLGAAVQGAAVYAHNASGALVGSGTTNASGVAVLNPGTGVITVTGYMAGYTIPSASATVSEGVNQTASLTATAANAPASANPTLCVLYCTLRGVNGVVASGVAGAVQVQSIPAEVSSAYLSNAALSATSGADGVISWSVPRGALVFVSVPGYLSLQLTVPSSASVDLSTL